MSAITSITGLQNLSNLQQFHADYNAFITVNLSGLNNLTIVDISDCKDLSTNEKTLTSVNLTGCTSLSQLRLDDSNISGTLDLSLLSSLINCNLTRNNISNVYLPESPLTDLYLNANALTTEAVSDILMVIDANGVEGGYVDLSGGTNAPVNTYIQTLKQSLNNKGWTVELNQPAPASVNISASTDFDIVGDFTIEMFISVSNLNGFPRPYSFGAYPAPNAISIEGGTLYFWGNNGILVNGNFGPNVGGWDHIAIVGEGSSVKIYTNGSLLATNSYSGSIPSQGLPLTIGYGNEPNSSLNGYMNNFRWSNVARYTGSSYTVPQAPFTNDSSTVALLFQGNNLSELLTDNSGKGHNALNAAATYSVVSPFPMLTYGSIQLGNI